MRLNYKILVVIFFGLAVFLRVLLCMLNPPHNAFDDHFTPVALIMQHDKIPAKNACWECFQPPIFYVVSAMIGNLSRHMGAKKLEIKKIIQYSCCLYGIITLAVILLILNKLYLSDFPKIMAFGVICFLPRHIYMSAMLSNDTISYLFVAICIYILIIAIERKYPLWLLAILSLTITITIFTKYNSLVIIPIVFVVFVLALVDMSRAERKRQAILFGLTLFVPVAILSVYMAGNIKNYGTPFPGNYEIFRNLNAKQPQDEGGVRFMNFKPWESIKTPILVPGKMNSFWTLIYSEMWFDTEPKFLYYMDSNKVYWKHYYRWLRGEEKFPGNNYSISKVTLLEGSVLITLGLFPVFLAIVGGYYYIVELNNFSKTDWMGLSKISIFPVLLITNAAGIIAITLKLPFYSTMKASYFLTSMPAFAVFLGNGVMAWEKNNILRWTIIIIFAALFMAVFWHIAHICLCLYLRFHLS